MEDFQVIDTQEKLNAVVSERVSREHKKHEALRTENEELKAKISDLNSQVEASKPLKSQVEELTGKVKSHEMRELKIKSALKHGLPYSLAERISGDDEKSIDEDAKTLAEYFKSTKPVAPLKNTESEPKDSKNAAYLNLIKNL